MEIVLSTAYLGPIQYYAKIVNSNKVNVEQFDSYQKQTYRNRCSILGANGILNLTVPVIKTFGNNTLVRDIKIDYATRWQINHWRSIVSAYNSSPFFEYYIDDFQPFFQKKYDFLIDFNQQLFQLIVDLLEIETELDLTKQFDKLGEFDNDYRDLIHPKQSKAKIDEHFFAMPYTQTLSNNKGFVPNLSIIDLLFNCGNESVDVLEKCILQ